MRFDREPSDGRSEPELPADAARLALRDILVSGSEERDALLSALLCAAWPSGRAQNQ